MAFQPVSWVDGDDITAEKLNQMAQNIDELYKLVNITSGSVQGGSGSTGETTAPAKIHFVKVWLPATGTKRTQKQVSFADANFTTDEIVVVASPGYRQRGKCWVTIGHINESSGLNWPDRTGCTVYARYPDDVSYKFDVVIPCHVIAMGK